MRKDLVEAREKLGLTQAQVAKSAGVSRSFYGLIETGARNPNYGLAKRIAAILKKPVASLFFDLDGFRMKQKPPTDDQVATTEPGPKPAA